MASEQAASPSKKNQSARSCIFLFAWGGQPQQDLWDVKPEAPDGIRSPFQPIATNAPGILLGDQLPLLARQADKLAIVRSLTHNMTDHQTSVYHALTGRVMTPPRVFPANARTRSDFPSIGSMFSYLGEKSLTPASFSIPRAVAHDGLFYAGTHAGFLGSMQFWVLIPTGGLFYLYYQAAVEVEVFLSAQFGQSYQEYRDRVGRFFPKL